VRIILISGKGGVGKTTVAAATGLASARKGHRTLVLSFDLAHSLSDSFDLQTELLSRTKGLPVCICENLDIQEIDVQEEMERHWKEIYSFSASLMVGGGLEQVMADEVAIMPGMEDIVALINLNQYAQAGEYDVIVLDCPPTSETLRFVSISTTLDWYVRKRLTTDRRMAKLVRPLLRHLGEAARLYLPEDEYFATLENIFNRLKGVEELLRDPTVTTVRLVTNAEKMVVRETQRAFMYFCMYGITIDGVVINKIMPREDGYFSAWAATQLEYIEAIKSYFEPVPISKLQMFPSEVCGLEALDDFSRRLYREEDASRIFVEAPSYGFKKVNDREYSLEIGVPFAPRDQIDISRKEDDLVVRIGTFKRNIPLPRSIQNLDTAGASVEEGRLTVRFCKPAVVA
jgi:arsenite-transporting ATPase